MLARTSQEDHRQRVAALVGRWLEERQALIAEWGALRAAVAVGAPAPLTGFCQILMDYVSAGHFEVYDELLAEAERLHALPPSGSHALLVRLQDTTDAAIRFNDLCDQLSAESRQEVLARELPILGLESRFQTEDRLIALLHESDLTAR
jgi:regulator of sigma D